MILVLFCVWEDAKSGLIEITPLIDILTVEDPYPVFLPLRVCCQRFRGDGGSGDSGCSVETNRTHSVIF